MDIKTTQLNYVLATTDFDHPRFLSKTGAVRAEQPFLALAAIFPSKESVDAELAEIISQGGRNQPPFEVMTLDSAKALPNQKHQHETGQ